MPDTEASPSRRSGHRVRKQQAKWAAGSHPPLTPITYTPTAPTSSSSAIRSRLVCSRYFVVVVVSSWRVSPYGSDAPTPAVDTLIICAPCARSISATASGLQRWYSRPVAVVHTTFRTVGHCCPVLPGPPPVLKKYSSRRPSEGRRNHRPPIPPSSSSLGRGSNGSSWLTLRLVADPIALQRRWRQPPPPRTGTRGHKCISPLLSISASRSGISGRPRLYLPALSTDRPLRR
mmetsp:Transcript_26423/g.68373  ORF Transcript_26423/g.68373 Transcript_26423/m.68373 type:complete len:232 (+) Transcript_26423:2060-2755(+)